MSAVILYFLLLANDLRHACRQHHRGYLDTPLRVRIDVSATLFISAPEDYDGGELVIEDTSGQYSVKLPAGDMIVYPGTSLHNVTPGSRIASFFRMQSLIRDDGRRALLFNLLDPELVTFRVAKAHRRWGPRSPRQHRLRLVRNRFAKTIRRFLRPSFSAPPLARFGTPSCRISTAG
jgi:hypothetical protein